MRYLKIGSAIPISHSPRCCLVLRYLRAFRKQSPNIVRRVCEEPCDRSLPGQPFPCFLWQEFDRSILFWRRFKAHIPPQWFQSGTNGNETDKRSNSPSFEQNTVFERDRVVQKPCFPPWRSATRNIVSSRRDMVVGSSSLSCHESRGNGLPAPKHDKIEFTWISPGVRNAPAVGISSRQAT
jgi:hypothetical protein